MYKCPKCDATRKDEVRERLAGILLITMTYEGGCYMKFKKTGAVWKSFERKCIKEDK